MSQLSMAALGLLCLSLLLWLRARPQKQLAHALQRAQEVRPNELQEWYQRSQQLLDDRGWLVFCRGQVSQANLTTPMSAVSCAAYQSKIERVASRNTYQSRTIVYQQQVQGHCFICDDKADVPLYLEQGAEIDPALYQSQRDEFSPQKPAQPSFPVPADDRQTLGFQLHESALTNGQSLSVFAEAKVRQGVFSLAKPEKLTHCLLSPLSKAALVSQQGKIAHENAFSVWLLCVLAGLLVGVEKDGLATTTAFWSCSGFFSLLFLAYHLRSLSFSKNKAQASLGLALLFAFSAWWLSPETTPIPTSTPNETLISKPHISASKKPKPSLHPPKLAVPDINLNPQTAALEQQYFVLYQRLEQVAKEMKYTLIALQLPEGFRYSQADWQAYEQSLAAAMAHKPDLKPLLDKDLNKDQARKLMQPYRFDIATFDQDIANITGLPVHHIALYREVKGKYRLKQWLEDLPSVANRQWLAWYFALAAYKTPKEALFIDDGTTQMVAAQMRVKFSAITAEFMTHKRLLLKSIQQQLAQTSEPVHKNQLLSRLVIYKILAYHAGRVTGFARNLAGYPALRAKRKHYPKAAALSEHLGVAFSELAFIQRKGVKGLKLRQLVDELTWLDKRAALYAITH